MLSPSLQAIDRALSLTKVVAASWRERRHLVWRGDSLSDVHGGQAEGLGGGGGEGHGEYGGDKDLGQHGVVRSFVQAH